MGAPGFTPYPELPPHAPMPGAPPYPGRPVPPPAPVGRPPAAGTGVGRVLAAAAVWAVVDIVLTTIVGPGPVALARLGAGVLLSAVPAAVAVGAIARRRAWSFWLLLVVMAPVYWVLRAVVTAFVG